MRIRCFVFLQLLMLSACSHVMSSARSCSVEWGEPWREYRSKHFVVDSDLSRGAASVLIGKLEHMHALVVSAMLGGPAEIPGYIRVVAFADPAQFRTMTRASEVGGYSGRIRFGEPVIVIHAAGTYRSGNCDPHGGDSRVGSPL
jgi:hypothetical protein